MESKTWWSIVLLIISCVMLFTIRKRNPTGSIKNGICWIIVIVSTIFSLLELVLSKYENMYNANRAECHHIYKIDK